MPFTASNETLPICGVAVLWLFRGMVLCCGCCAMAGWKVVMELSLICSMTFLHCGVVLSFGGIVVLFYGMMLLRCVLPWLLWYGRVVRFCLVAEM